MKIRKRDSGRQCSIWHEISGNVTGMILDVTENGFIRVFVFENSGVLYIDKSQITNLGDFIIPHPPTEIGKLVIVYKHNKS